MWQKVHRTLLGTPRRAATTVAVLLLLVGVAYVVVPAVQAVGAWIGVLALAAIYLIRAFPNEGKQLLGRTLGYMSWISTSIEREGVRQDVEGTLSAGVADLIRGSPQAGGGAVRLTFIRSGEELELLPDGTLLIGIAHHKDRGRNLVAAAWAYARRAVLVEARRHLDRDVSRGIDYAVTKAILSRADVRAISSFIQEIWVPVIQDQARLRNLTSKLEALEEDELLAPVLLEEFAELGTRLANHSPSDEVAQETAHFVEHLYQLTRREPGRKDPTHFDGRSIRCGFILVATAKVVAEKGANPYRQAVDWLIRSAYPRVYLIARGHFVEYAREVAGAFVTDPRVLETREYAVSVPGGRGESIPRSVTRLRIDVREYTSFGQRPIVAVGGAYEEKLIAARAEQRRRARR